MRYWLYLNLLLLLFLPATVLAGDIPIEEIQVRTPAYQPKAGVFRPAFGTYTYRVSWQGIPAATVTAALEQEGSTYRVVTTAKTYKAIDLLYKLRYRGEGLVSAADFTPLKATYEQKENSRHKRVEIDYLPDGTIRSVRTKRGETEIITFNPHNLTLDPFTAALLARSLEWRVGETKVFDTFNGRTRYLISLKADSKKIMKVNGREREVFVIVPKVENLTNPEKNKKFRGAEIYVTADEKREPLLIESKVFVGSVKTQLVSYTPSSQSQGSTQVAREPKAQAVYIQ